jgi:hypothetical protein
MQIIVGQTVDSCIKNRNREVSTVWQFCDSSRRSGLENTAQGDYLYRGTRNVKFSDICDVARGALWLVESGDRVRSLTDWCSVDIAVGRGTEEWEEKMRNR